MTNTTSTAGALDSFLGALRDLIDKTVELGLRGGQNITGRLTEVTNQHIVVTTSRGKPYVARLEAVDVAHEKTPPAAPRTVRTGSW